MANYFIEVNSMVFTDALVQVYINTLANSLFLQTRKWANVIRFDVVRNRSNAVQPYL